MWNRVRSSRPPPWGTTVPLIRTARISPEAGARWEFFALELKKSVSARWVLSITSGRAGQVGAERVHLGGGRRGEQGARRGERGDGAEKCLHGVRRTRGDRRFDPIRGRLHPGNRSLCEELDRLAVPAHLEHLLGGAWNSRNFKNPLRLERVHNARGSHEGAEQPHRLHGRSGGRGASPNAHRMTFLESQAYLSPVQRAALEPAAGAASAPRRRAQARHPGRADGDDRVRRGHGRHGRAWSPAASAATSAPPPSTR